MTGPMMDEMTGSDVRAWLASLPVVMGANACDQCGHTGGPFVALPHANPLIGSQPVCHLCAVRSQAMDEWEAQLLAGMFLAGLEALSKAGDGIMPESIGRAAVAAGERFLADWRGR